jgi:hypothetical protein
LTIWPLAASMTIQVVGLAAWDGDVTPKMASPAISREKINPGEKWSRRIRALLEFGFIFPFHLYRYMKVNS